MPIVSDFPLNKQELNNLKKNTNVTHYIFFSTAIFLYLLSLLIVCILGCSSWFYCIFLPSEDCLHHLVFHFAGQSHDARTESFWKLNMILKGLSNSEDRGGLPFITLLVILHGLRKLYASWKKKSCSQVIPVWHHLFIPELWYLSSVIFTCIQINKQTLTSNILYFN